MTDVEDKTAALLAALWIKNRPIIEERLATLDGAAVAAAAGALSDEQRRVANSTAHKLAGALGMYGYDDGTRIARELEVLLAEAGPDAGRLSALIAELRAAIFPAA